MLQCGGRQIAVTEAGFLIDAGEWDPAVARALATTIGLELTPDHWEIIDLLRSYYFRYQHLPNNRMLVKWVQKELGEAKGNSRYLHRLFPESPVKLACLVAGLPKPPGCI